MTAKSTYGKAIQADYFLLNRGSFQVDQTCEHKHLF